VVQQQVQESPLGIREWQHNGQEVPALHRKARSVFGRSRSGGCSSWPVGMWPRIRSMQIA
jgi:hypothetical protein